MATWLDVVSDQNEWSLVDTGRMARVVREMSHPAHQYPSLLFCLGRTVKVQALRSLFRQNNITRRDGPGLARLHLSATTARTQHPVWVIDGELHTRPRAAATTRWPRRALLMDGHRSYEAAQHRCCARILLPLADVVCLFVDDLGGRDAVAALLQRWTCESAHGTVTYEGRPQLVVVDTGPDAAEWLSSLAGLTSSSPYRRCFADAPRVVRLRDRERLSPCARFAPLRTAIVDQLQSVRGVREARHLLLSAVHIHALADAAARAITTRPTAVFDLIRAAREGNEVDATLTQHLTTFLHLAVPAGWSDGDLVSFVASALLLDGYPPGMHRFDPAVLFRRLYAGHCEAAWAAVPDVDPTERCRAIEVAFIGLFDQLSTRQSAAQIRRDVVAPQRRLWSTLTTTTTCLFCVRRAPEHALPCGHALCDVCVRIFGTRSRRVGHRFDFDRCLLCRQAISLSIQLLPPTKRPNVLVLDGGGVRGDIELKYLCALQDRCGTVQLPELFHLSVGTSVGTLNNFELHVIGSSPHHAQTKFPPLAKGVFASTPPRTAAGRAWALVRHLLRDGRYDSSVLDRTLQEAFGRHRRLFGSANHTVVGTRVAATVSHIANGQLCLFTNYRGIGRPQETSAYQVLVPRTAAEEPRLWEVYFPTFYLPGWGHFQDGGVRANNPVKVARRECAIIWPAAERPDVILSIGTGYHTPPAPPVDRPARGILRDGFIARLLRSQLLCSPALDGEQAWQEAWDEMPAELREDSFRLNRHFPQGLPELDDVRWLDGRDGGRYVIPSPLVRALLATLFYFELDEAPEERAGRLRCQGSILCSAADASGAVDGVLAEFPGACFAVAGGVSLGRVEEDHGCRACGYYRQRVSFDVSSLHEQVALVLRGRTGDHRIASFPNPLQWFLDRQGATAAFGRADHDPQRWPRRLCYCTVGTKRAVHFVEPASTAKRCRL
ncbi:Leucine--tRNA ligase [Talaromyces islandicus]|uniref:Leucine--tRNA ligase n=1 Tax=Talaromyces islandicus TaxID=28573 RepID=A0A0U1MBA4_TALIS|nr:Leucine--tRNA ligase [Talaromyces islandicus]